MNKKFSTLMAVFLAAGATFTAEAGVVKVITPVNGKSYVIAADATITADGKLPAAYYVAVNEAGDQAVGGYSAEAISALTNLPAWTVGYHNATEPTFGYTLKNGGKALSYESATKWAVSETSLTSVGLGIFVLDGTKLGIDADGTGGAKPTVDQKVVLPASPNGNLTADATGSALAFYANGYDEGVEKIGGMDSNLKNSVGKDDFVFIKIGDKFVSVAADGSTVETVSADALKTTLGKWRATFKVKEGGKKFIALANADAKELKAGANDAGFTLDGTGTEFYFDESDHYIGEKGASMFDKAPTAAGNDAVVVDSEGKFHTATGVVVGGRAEVKIYKSSEYLVATPGSAVHGMPNSLVYAEEFVNGGSYYLSSDGAYFVTTDATGALSTSNLTPGANALWKVIQTKGADGDYSYTFYNAATDTYMKALNSGKGQTTYTSYVARQGYTGGFVLTNANGALTVNSSGATMTSVAAKYANQIIGLYLPGNVPYSAAELKAFQNGSFSMTIATDKDNIGKKTIKGSDVFAGSLIPVPETGTTDANAVRFRLKDSDGKYIVLNSKSVWGDASGLNGTNNKGAKFEKVAFADIDKEGYYSWFTVSYPLINGKEDNQEFVVDVYKAVSGGISEGRLFISEVDKNYYLTVAKSIVAGESWAYVKNGGSDLVDLKTFLQKGKFYTVARVNAEYQIEKVLGTSSFYYRAADWLDKGAVQMDQPEGQWAASVDAGKLVLTNRESLVAYNGLGTLYGTDKEDIYKNGDKLYQIKVVEKHAATDGYEAWTNTQLRDEQYTLGFYSNVLGAAAYMSENHSNKHLIGLEKDIKDATAWDVKAFDAKRTDDAQTDSVYVVSNLYFWNKDKKGGADWDWVSDTLKTVSYTFTNASNGEPVKYNSAEDAYICDPTANVEGDRFAIKKMADGRYNLVAVVTNDAEEDADKYYILASNKMYGGFSVAQGNVNRTDKYNKSENDLAVIEKTAAPEYVKRSMGDTIRIFREGAEASILFEKGEFLGLENIHEFTKMAPAMYVDTAYYNRGTNNRWQYLLGVEIDRKVVNDDCGVPSHEKFLADTTYGRFLVNLVDSAELYKKTHLHDNKYVNTEGFAKLGFVKGFHTNDTLVIQRNGVLIPAKADSIYMGDKDFNVAKFAFRIVDHETNVFKIETLYKKYSDGPAAKADKLGYLKWMNGFVVVVNDINNGDTFNLEADHSAPTANDNINATSFGVTTREGAVVITGAEGKTVTISNVLGQTVATATITSNEAVISAPAGYVTVAVEGEAAVKAIVK